MGQLQSIIIQIFLGIIAADILSGFFHWIEDNYLDDYCSEIPFVSSIIKDNELHHYYPRGVLAYDYIEHLTLTLPTTILILLVIFYNYPKLFYKYILFFIVFGFFSSTAAIIHRISHMRDCELSFPIKILQKFAIISSHEHHKVHHEISDSRYCSVTGLTNYVLDYIKFWRFPEAIIFLLTGITPKRRPVYNDYSEIHNELHTNAKKPCPDKPNLNDIDHLFKVLDKYKMCDI
jgi:hypothetical protein